VLRRKSATNAVDLVLIGSKLLNRTIKIWDYQNKSCVQTIDSPAANISFAVFHPSLPLIISGSEDGTVKLWNSSTYRLESTLSYGLERCWCVAYRKNGNEVALGYDEGLVVLKVSRSHEGRSYRSSKSDSGRSETSLAERNLPCLWILLERSFTPRTPRS
jgi:coatomer subunit beta'